MAGTVFQNVTTDDLVNMLLCPEEKPLYDMGFSSVFDYEALILDPLMEQLTEKMDGAFNIKELGLDDFSDFSEGVDWNTYMTGQNMVGYNQVKYDEADNQQTFKTCVDGKDSTLDQVRNDMSSVASFGDAVYPRVNAASNDIQNIVKDLMNKTRTTINGGVDTITCMSLKCVYSPVKNSACVYLQDGTSWWILSSFCLMIGMFIMSFVVCCRRRGLKNPSVVNETEDSTSESDLADFSSRT